MEHADKTMSIKAVLDTGTYASHTPRERQRALAGQIAVMRQRRGENSTPADIAGVAAMLDADLVRYYGRLSLDEILLALDWGMRLEWGDYTAVTVDNLLRFVKSYAESDERAEAVDMRRNERALPPPKENDPRTDAISDWYARTKAEVAARRAARLAANRPG